MNKSLKVRTYHKYVSVRDGAISTRMVGCGADGMRSNTEDS